MGSARVVVLKVQHEADGEGLHEADEHHQAGEAPGRPEADSRHGLVSNSAFRRGMCGARHRPLVTRSAGRCRRIRDTCNV